jgi:hypothetical protein
MCIFLCFTELCTGRFARLKNDRVNPIKKLDNSLPVVDQSKAMGSKSERTTSVGAPLRKSKFPTYKLAYFVAGVAPKHLSRKHPRVLTLPNIELDSAANKRQVLLKRKEKTCHRLRLAHFSCPWRMPLPPSGISYDHVD